MPFLFHFLPPFPSLYLFSPFSVTPPFLFPALPFLLILLCLFSLLALSPSLAASHTYGRKAAQAQGNGINFHSRLNSQSISLELNTLPPIRKSQGSISPFPRRHSPAIQRQPRQPCLTFWRCMDGRDRTGAPACCSFLQAAQTTWQTSRNLYDSIHILFLHLMPSAYLQRDTFTENPSKTYKNNKQ